MSNTLTMKREKLHELAAAYDADKSQTSLDAIKSFLKRNTIYFKKYYDNTEGKSPKVLGNYQESGKFIDFTESTQFHIPSLLIVHKSSGETVYVSLNDIDFE